MPKTARVVDTKIKIQKLGKNREIGASISLLKIGCTKKRSAEYTITSITLGSAQKIWFD